MKITELLTLLIHKGEINPSIEIFRDGSGRIQDINNKKIISFINEEYMQFKLNQLYQNLNKKQIKFEL